MVIETTSLAQAMALVQTKLPRIERDKTADVKTEKTHYKYTYADLAQVTAKLMPILGDHGLSFIARPTLHEGKLVLDYQLLHVSGESLSGQYPLPSSGGPQQIGSAITYARRYCLCSVTGIAPEEDDDGAAAQAEQAGQRGSAQRATQPRQATGRTRQAQRSAPPLPGEEGITVGQQQKLHALLRDLGLTTREVGLAAISEVLGAPVESTKDLSSEDARKVIGDFEARVATVQGEPTPEEIAEHVAAMEAGQ